MIGKNFAFSTFASHYKTFKTLKEMQENNMKNQSQDEELPMEVNEDTLTGGEETEMNDASPTNKDDHSKLEQELADQKEKYVRLFAEFDNYKRRSAREAMEQRQTAGKEIIISLLDVLDDMDRAEQQLRDSDADKSVKEGILLVFDKFRKTLQSRGLKPIETLNSDFDVEKDEAVSEIQVDDKKKKGKVVAELQKGYLLNDKLIRFAKVVVGK